MIPPFQQPIFSPWATNDFGAQWYKHRAMAVGLLVTLLVHLLLLFILLHARTPEKIAASQKAPAAIAYIAPSAPEVEKKWEEPKTKPVTKPRPITPPKPAPKISKAGDITLPLPPQPTPPPEPPVVVEATPPPTANPPVDFMAALNAKRQARQEADAKENASAQTGVRGPAANDAALANINRNLQTLSNARDGTSGVFQILNKGTRVATFSFNGWTQSSNKWREVIEVDAGVGGNVELAVVKRMIALIRTHYQGDFSWNSEKLGRVVVLSARQTDNAGLEEFLMREFFG